MMVSTYIMRFKYSLSVDLDGGDLFKLVVITTLESCCIRAVLFRKSQTAQLPTSLVARYTSA